MISSFRITSKNLILLIIAACAEGCSSTQARRAQLTEGNISYPFVSQTSPLGNTLSKRPIVIKSAVGASEYTVEIPDDASRYDIQIPLAELSPAGTSPTALSSSQPGLNPATTDKELVAALPSLAKSKPGETAVMDAAFGVGTPEGPVQSPSYSLGIAKVNQYYREKNFELALVELNNLIAFYPNSAKLLKMKGTLLIKTGNRDLAMKSWQRAYDLAPNDSALKRSIDRLNDRILAEQNARRNIPSETQRSTITPIAPDPGTTPSAVGH